MSRFKRTENSVATPLLPHNLSANLTPEHQARVGRILRHTRVMEYPRLSTDAKTLFVVSALCADANGEGSADAIRVALSDPVVLAVARALMAQAVFQ